MYDCISVTSVTLWTPNFSRWHQGCLHPRITRFHVLHHQKRWAEAAETGCFLQLVSRPLCRGLLSAARSGVLAESVWSVNDHTTSCVGYPSLPHTYTRIGSEGHPALSTPARLEHPQHVAELLNNTQTNSSGVCRACNNKALKVFSTQTERQLEPQQHIPACNNTPHRRTSHYQWLCTPVSQDSWGAHRCTLPRILLSTLLYRCTAAVRSQAGPLLQNARQTVIHASAFSQDARTHSNHTGHLFVGHQHEQRRKDAHTAACVVCGTMKQQQQRPGAHAAAYVGLVLRSSHSVQQHAHMRA